MQPLVSLLQTNFRSQKSLALDYRKNQLASLIALLKENKLQLAKAQAKDLGRHPSDTSEFSAVIREATDAIDSLDQWAAPEVRKEANPLFLFDSPQVRRQPLGLVLIISPWNFPVLLAIQPLIGAIAAGCAAIIKPSEIAPHTAKVLATLIPKYLDNDLYRVVLGGVEETTNLLIQRFDHIFYTGSTNVGKIIMAAAAKNLTPVTLELGGKSPCFIDQHLTPEQIKNVGRRVAFGKLTNCGQICVAPDYIIVHPKVHDEFIKAYIEAIESSFTKDPSKAETYSKIVNKSHHSRLTALVASQLAENQNSKLQIVGSEKENLETLYFPPMIITGVSLDREENPIMRDEIFGPILPILKSDFEEGMKFVNGGEKPLALYVFSNNDQVIEKIVDGTSSGGVCVNWTILHIISSLPFGGVGHSGMGSYHGKQSFDTFSHKRSVLKRSINYDSIQSSLYPKSKFNPAAVRSAESFLEGGPKSWGRKMVERALQLVWRGVGVVGWVVAAYLYFASSI